MIPKEENQVTRVNKREYDRLENNLSLPVEWMEVLCHPKTKDKPSLLLKLKYEMTVDDVLDLKEYYEYENLISYEDYLRQKESSNSR